MESKYKYLGKNTLIFAINSFGTKILSFLLVPLYTNILSTEEYGVADLITTTATLMMYLFTINVADAVLRFTLDKKTDPDEILSYGSRVTMIGSLLLILTMILVWWSGLVPWDDSYYLYVFGFYFFTASYQLLTNYLRAIDDVKAVAIAGIISSLSMILCNILFLVVVRIGITGYLLALIIGPFCGSLYSLLRIKLPLRVYFRKTCDAATRKAMRAYCIPLIFNNIALWINAFLDKYFVTAICGVDQNGIYAVAYKIPTILSICYTVFSQAWNLSAIKEFDKDDKDGFFSDTYRVYNSLIVCICSGLILINVPLARLLFAKDFFEAWNYSSVLLISVMFNAMTAFLGSIFSAVKKSRIIAVTTLISAAVNTVLNALLIPVIGVQGAAIATAACYVVMWAVRYVVIRRYITLRITLWRDIIAYCLLCGQVVLEHLNGHCYIGQIAVLLAILLLYRKNIVQILSAILPKAKKNGGNK